MTDPGRTLLRGARVVTTSAGRPDAERIDVLVDGDRIAEIDADLDHAGADIVDLPGRVITPGLVNARTSPPGRPRCDASVPTGRCRST
ncbi:MAG: hypothetical protein HYX34_11585 [Actinobacteria bacterium]|nr:hypothetical protein [Actinomycetota bacterium]